VSFAAPAGYSGQAIVDYSATCSAAGQKTSVVTAANGPIAVTGLVNGITYACTVVARSAAGTGAASASVTATPNPSVAFVGNVVLGAPTANTISANVYSPSQSGVAYIAYGSRPGAYAAQTAPQKLGAGQPVEFSLTGLTPDARYYYRLFFTPDQGGPTQSTTEYGFHTPRPAGASFVFDVQGDSHPEREKSEFNGDLYTRTLGMAAADSPDFFITSGDDFSVDTLNSATITASQVQQRYQIQRPYLSIVGRQAPVFLVNGNHEQAARELGQWSEKHELTGKDGGPLSISVLDDILSSDDARPTGQAPPDPR
jgi:hypothetical protein